MACECRISGLFDTGGIDGIISASITGSQEFVDIVSQCSTGPNVFTDVRRVLTGPSLGNLTLTTYAVPKGSTNKYLGTSCPSQAGIDFPTQSRFDCENNVTHIIRTKTGQAFREGDPIDGITLVGEFCSFRTVSASAQSGPTERITDTTRFLGRDLVWTGEVFPFDSQNADSLDFNIFGLDVMMTSFSISVAVPDIATCNYSFQYTIEACSGA